MAIRVAGRSQQQQTQQAVRSFSAVNLRGSCPKTDGGSESPRAQHAAYPPRSFTTSTNITINSVSQDNNRGSEIAPLRCFDLTVSEDDDGQK
jgi:hypothetical protein